MYGMLQTAFGASCMNRASVFDALSNLDEPDMQNTAGEAGTSSKVMYFCGPPHMDEHKLKDRVRIPPTKGRMGL